MKITICFILLFSSLVSCYSQRLPKEIRRNLISIVNNPESTTAFDTLILYPDNDNFDTANAYYMYWVYHGRSKFYAASIDHRHTNIAGGIWLKAGYEKWKIRKYASTSMLTIKQYKKRTVTKYNIFYNKNADGKINSVVLIKRDVEDS